MYFNSFAREFEEKTLENSEYLPRIPVFSLVSKTTWA